MAVGKKRQTLDQLPDAACSRIRRYASPDALTAIEDGAVLVDIRSGHDRLRDGIVAGSLHIPRTVLEWRVEPESDWRSPYLGDLDQQIILMCDHGCADQAEE